MSARKIVRYILYSCILFSPSCKDTFFHIYSLSLPPWPRRSGFFATLSLLFQYLRDIILGVNDGLVSMFLLVFGMFGGGALARSILLAGITGAIAGAISMGLGEYIATKSQLEIMVSDVSRERYEFALHCLHRFRRQ